MARISSSYKNDICINFFYHLYINDSFIAEIHNLHEFFA